MPGTTPLPTVLKGAGYDTWRMGKYGNEYFAAAQACDFNLNDNDEGDGDEANRAFA